MSNEATRAVSSKHSVREDPGDMAGFDSTHRANVALDLEVALDDLNDRKAIDGGQVRVLRRLSLTTWQKSVDGVDMCRYTDDLWRARNRRRPTPRQCHCPPTTASVRTIGCGLETRGASSLLVGPGQARNAAHETLGTALTYLPVSSPQN